MDTHLGNGLRSLLVSLAHVSDQDAALCAVVDMLAPVALPTCTLLENDTGVDEYPHSPIAVRHEKVPLAHFCCLEWHEEPLGTVRDLIADSDDEAKVSEVLSLSEQ